MHSHQPSAIQSEVIKFSTVKHLVHSVKKPHGHAYLKTIPFMSHYTLRGKCYEYALSASERAREFFNSVLCRQ